MAEADVVFKIRADLADAIENLKAAEKALEMVGEQAEKAAPKIKQAEKALTPMAALAKGFGDQWKANIPTMEQFGAKLANLLNPMAALQVAAAAVAAGFAAFAAFTIKGIQAAAENEEAVNRLRAALAAQGAETEANVSALTKYASTLAMTTRFTDEAIMAAQTLGLRINIAAHQMPAATEAAINMASALGMTLDEAMQALAQTLDGTGGRIMERVPELKALSEEALRAGGAFDVVREKFREAAEKDVAGLAGSFARLKIAVGEAVEAFGVGLTSGGEFTNALSLMADAVNGLIPLMEMAGRTISNFATFALFAADSYLTFVQSILDVAAKIPGTIGMAFGAASGAIDLAKASVRALKLEFQTLAAVGRTAGNAAAGIVTGGRGGAGPARDTSDTEKAIEALRRERAAAVDVLDVFMEANLTQGERLRLADGLAKQAEAAENKLRELMMQGKLSTQEFNTELERSRDIYGQIANVIKADLTEALEAFKEKSRSLVVDIIPVGTEGLDVAAQELSAEQTREDERAWYLEQMQLRQEAMDAVLQFTHANDELTASIERQREAWNSLTPAQQRHEIQLRNSKARMDALEGGMSMMTAAAGNLGAGIMRMALTGEGSFKKMAQAALQSLAIEAAGKAVFELAEGLAMLALAAFGHPTAGASAGMHFQAAAVYGAMAAAFGAASAIAGQPGGGGGGGASGEGRGAETGRSNASTVEATQDESTSRGPRVQVTFTGNGIIAGQSPEQFARAVQPFLEEVFAEGGGRQGTRR